MGLAPVRQDTVPRCTRGVIGLMGADRRTLDVRPLPSTGCKTSLISGCETGQSSDARASRNLTPPSPVPDFPSIPDVCPRCCGPVSESTQLGELASCLKCGWRLYAPSGAPLSKPVTRSHPAVGLTQTVPYRGRHPAMQEWMLVITISRRGILLECPFCAGRMDRRRRFPQIWVCSDGHSVQLLQEQVGEEVVGWA